MKKTDLIELYETIGQAIETLTREEKEEYKENYMDLDEVQNFLAIDDYFSNNVKTPEKVKLLLDSLVFDVDCFTQDNEINNIDIMDLMYDIKKQAKKLKNTLELLEYINTQNYRQYEDYKPINKSLSECHMIAIKENNKHILSVIKDYCND